MEKFIEIFNPKDGSTHAIAISNIALISQKDVHTTEIYLLTKKDGEQIKYTVHYNYGHFKHLLQSNEYLAMAAPLNAS